MTANNKKPILLTALFLSITAALATDFFLDAPEPEKRVILKQAHRFSIMDEPKFVE